MLEHCVDQRSDLSSLLRCSSLTGCFNYSSERISMETKVKCEMVCIVVLEKELRSRCLSEQQSSSSALCGQMTSEVLTNSDMDRSEDSLMKMSLPHDPVNEENTILDDSSLWAQEEMLCSLIHCMQMIYSSQKNHCIYTG